MLRVSLYIDKLALLWALRSFQLSSSVPRSPKPLTSPFEFLLLFFALSEPKKHAWELESLEPQLSPNPLRFQPISLAFDFSCRDSSWLNEVRLATGGKAHEPARKLLARAGERSRLHRDSDKRVSLKLVGERGKLLLARPSH